MSQSYDKWASQLLVLVGGCPNIKNVYNCMTRLRFTLRDDQIPDDKAVEALDHVIGVIRQGGQYQVVVGVEAEAFGMALKQQMMQAGEESEQSIKQEPSEAVPSKKNRVLELFQSFCGFVSGCMSPLVPAMMGCGMIKAIVTLVVSLGLLSAGSYTYVILRCIGDSLFYFLPILLAYTTAKKVGTNEVMAMVVACFMLHPNLTRILAVRNVHFFNIPVIPATYSATVLPVLLLVPLMHYIELFADHVCPKMIKSTVKPVFELGVSVPLALLVVGPLGSIAGDGLAFLLQSLDTHAGWLVVMLLAASMPFIVMTGMHYMLFPLVLTTIAKTGYESVILVSMYCANLAQGAAGLGVAMKIKRPEMRSATVACGLSAIISGVTEPVFYGVNLRLRTPLYAAVAGAAAGGLFAGIMQLHFRAVSNAPSLVSIVLFVGGRGTRNIVIGVITAVIVMTISCVLALLFHNEEAAIEELTKLENENDDSKEQIQAPVTGETVALEELSDSTFSILGKGIAIEPHESELYAPADGTVRVQPLSKHAIGLRTASGMQLLIHVGIDTVKLQGEYFDCKVENGQSVKQGQLLMTMNSRAIREAGYALTTAVIVTNPGWYLRLDMMPAGRVVQHGCGIITGTKKPPEE